MAQVLSAGFHTHVYVHPHTHTHTQAVCNPASPYICSLVTCGTKWTTRLPLNFFGCLWSRCVGEQQALGLLLSRSLMLSYRLFIQCPVQDSLAGPLVSAIVHVHLTTSRRHNPVLGTSCTCCFFHSCWRGWILVLVTSLCVCILTFCAQEGAGGGGGPPLHMSACHVFGVNSMFAWQLRQYRCIC